MFTGSGCVDVRCGHFICVKNVDFSCDVCMVVLVPVFTDGVFAGDAVAQTKGIVKIARRHIMINARAWILANILFNVKHSS